MTILQRMSQSPATGQGAPAGQAQNLPPCQPPAQQSGSSTQNPQPSNNNSRFGRGRFGGGNNNQNQPNNQPPQNQNSNQPNNPFGRGQSNQNQMASWAISPLHKTLVRFSLQGLGDPFYRLLGHPLNGEFGKSQVLAATLEQGGEAVDALAQQLETVWLGYQLKGAALVYPRLMAFWEGVSKPVPMPGMPDWLGDIVDEEQGRKQATDQVAPFKLLRALDLALVMNVLARSRSQLLLATSPLVMSQQYMRRTLLSDDPRLVELALATGCVENVLVAVSQS